MKFITDAQVETTIPKYYRLSYTDFVRDWDVYYPLPINYIIRYWRKHYWRFLRAVYRIGLIDTTEGKCFCWNDFYRIKTH